MTESSIERPGRPAPHDRGWEGFEESWCRHDRHFRKYAWRRLGNAHDGDEALQRAALNLLEGYYSGPGPGPQGEHFTKLAWRVLNNAIIDVARARQRRIRLEDTGHDAEAVPDEAPGSRLDDAIEAQEQLARIERELRKDDLADNHREALLSLLERLGTGDDADKNPQSTDQRALLMRARASLKRLLGLK